MCNIYFAQIHNDNINETITIKLVIKTIIIITDDNRREIK